jgi:uncharacterized integral membrane protein
MDTKEPQTTDQTPETSASPTTPEPITPQVNLVDAEPIKVAMEATPSTPAPIVGVPVKSKSNKYTIITVVVVVLALLVVLFQLERQERVQTNLFGGLIAALDANSPVAVVAGERLSAEDLATGVEQLERAEIETQALEMLINTTLLKQAAVDNNVVIEESAVTARVEEIATANGGLDALLVELAEFGIDEAQLNADVQEELLIRTWIEQLFATADLTVSPEEITEVYNNAVAASNGEVLPPLVEVTGQIEAQLRQSKEQATLDTYLQELRASADIQLN